MENLKPCPFCGSVIKQRNNQRISTFECPYCTAFISFFGANTSAKAVEKWNTRYHEKETESN